MNHDQLRDALSALHDGELGAEEHKKVFAHLEQCASCNEAYQGWKRIAGTFFRAPQKPSRAETEFFVKSVMARLETETVKNSIGWRVWFEERFMLPLLSMGLAAALVSIVMMRPESVASPDTLLLVNAQNSGVSQWVLPPDPAKAGMLMLSGDER